MTHPVINIKDMSREEWLAARANGLGGSDAGTVLGVNKWKSKTQLFFEKTDPKLDKELDNEFIYWGNVLEDVVAEEFARRTGKRVRRDNRMLRHPEHNFMHANLDRVVVGERALLECKTTSQYNTELWVDDEIPAQYLCQVQHYMAVTGYEKAYIAVLMGGNQFIWKEIPRDEELIDIIIEAEKDFWYNNVKAGVIPEIDGSDATKNFLGDMFKDVTDDEVVLSDRANVLMQAIEKCKAEVKETQALQQEYENELKHLIGNNLKGVTDKYVATWRPQKRNSLDRKRLEADHPDLVKNYLKTSEYRVLNIKPVKEEKDDGNI